MTVLIDKKEYNVIFIRKKVKRTFIKVNAIKDITITSYKNINQEGLKEIVNTNLGWIKSQINKIQTIEINENEFMVFGEIFSLVKDDNLLNDYKIIDKQIIYHGFGLDNFKKELMKEIEKYYFRILKEYDLNFIPFLIIKPMKSKWGVCHFKTHKVVINQVFIHLPKEFLEYVIHHELTHFFVTNHSTFFYKELAKKLPSHRKLQKDLKQYTFMLLK